MPRAEQKEEVEKETVFICVVTVQGSKGSTTQIKHRGVVYPDELHMITEAMKLWQKLHWDLSDPIEKVTKITIDREEK